ncbi:hypothetical protein Vafri_6185 [Volvox africanus]|nr:hypothetical protein Vafri_6185 [Volvox africanus]
MVPSAPNTVVKLLPSPPPPPSSLSLSSTSRKRQLPPQPQPQPSRPLSRATKSEKLRPTQPAPPNAPDIPPPYSPPIAQPMVPSPNAPRRPPPFSRARPIGAAILKDSSLPPPPSSPSLSSPFPAPPLLHSPPFPPPPLPPTSWPTPSQRLSMPPPPPPPIRSSSLPSPPSPPPPHPLMPPPPPMAEAGLRSEVKKFSPLVALVSVCGISPPPGIGSNYLRRLFLGAPGAFEPTIQSVMSSLSQGRVAQPWSNIFIAPEVIDIPCGGTGTRGTWTSAECTRTTIYSFSEFVSGEARRRWGVKTTADPYDRIILMLPQGTSCTESWGAIGCYPDFAGHDISSCPVVIDAMMAPTTFILDSLAHEMGHNLGLMHSKREGSTDEYGDETCLMGSGRGTCYNAPNMAFLRWAVPLMTLGSRQLPRGIWTPFVLPALASSFRNHLLIYPEWLTGPMGDPASGALYVSYRVPVGCDEGLDTAYAGGVQIHSYVNTGGSGWRNNTLYLGSSFLGQMWPSLGSVTSPRVISPPSLLLALRVVTRSPFTDSNPWVKLELCRYDKARETGTLLCSNGLDDDCDGLADQDDTDCDIPGE